MIDVKKLENKVLSVGGRATINEIEIPPYPKLMHLQKEMMDKEFIVEYKIDGANTRLVFLPEKNDFVALLRGGLLDQKMTEAAHKFSELFLNFFKEHPKKVLCTEILGTKTIANNSPEYFEKFGFEKDVVYFVFDVIDLEKQKFLPFEEKKQLCEEFSLQLVPVLGSYKNFDELVTDMKKMDIVFDGVVLKTPESSEIYKLRFDKNQELFPEHIIKKPKRLFVESEQARIVGHFLQGYEEKELGLESGITKQEFEKYQEFLEDLSKTVTRENVSQKVETIVDYLMNSIQSHGLFDEKMKSKIEKEFKSLIGKKVGKFLAKQK